MGRGLGLFGPRRNLTFRMLPSTVAFATVWVVRRWPGAVAGFYPYSFVDATRIG